MDDEAIDKIFEARSKVIEALTGSLGLWEHSSSSMITGWVTAVEYIDESGDYAFWWLCGSGEPSSESKAGIPAWRVEGLSRQIVADIHKGNVTDQ